jgi:magnesium-transporting ATPase (P-type)
MHARVQQLGDVKRGSRPRSVTEVLADVLRHLQEILRSEIRLVYVQARAEVRTLGSAGALIVAGVLGAFLSAFFLLFAIVAALSLIIKVWAAALLVSIVMAVVCAVLLRSGAQLIRKRAEMAAASAEPGTGEGTEWTGTPTE